MSTAVPTGDMPASGNGLPPILERMRAQPKLPLIVGGAAIVAAAAAFMLWSRAPDYKVLYTNVSDRDGGAIIASLQQMNVPYKFAEGGGAILIAGDKVAETRLKLAAQGLPKAGGVGFELMDNQKFGTSQFAEQVNYQRGLEGELARSIESIGTIEAARVHLALPKPSLFVRDQKKPSASVILTLLRGRSIDEGQVSAIVHMVSSSVPDLDAKSVTVVDQRGNLLSSARGTDRGLDVSQLKYAQEIEAGYIRRIEAILQPLVGASNVRAQVAADIDFAVVEHTDEKYTPNQDPKQAAVRSQQSSESAQNGGGAPGGVPGALSNQPPVNPTAPIVGPRAPNAPGTPPPGTPGAPGAVGTAGAAAATTSTASTGPSSTRKDTTTNYELDRTIRHVQQAAGGVKRLSVAVVVNNRDSVDAAGKTTSRALTPAEVEQIRNLAKEAMGFSTERGDSLNVVNSAFARDADSGPGPEVPFWKDRDNIEIGKSVGQYLLYALIALFAWLAVVRPLMRRHAPPPPAPLPVASTDADADTPPPAVADANAPTPEESLREREANRKKADMDYAHQIADKDPKLVAALIQHWMNSDE
ncbi:flagellar basal-body MS-ring/collar protein FliF [Variovorax sp. J22G73]|jgi:flagellar M-ring protein FliF|uniref:flagellar basal-body MS-ring/collar protein FliF n=1 Tax=unclassified Variovorax TaxID=663243 RepID=UPI000D5D5C29|nr:MULTISPECIES: flagellar basal-body MS-ring/collar protein FliF [unclassified Variovorax]MDM0007968.1 flagellar basal-body MS-ring/collar protein FliF [Variovorax sp. J22R203]MDM0100410.1 flagellar basal-body MS-ring/collar protein FliF [Variovorax sp. J22G73]